MNNPGLGLPSVTLTGVPNNRYFQYRATLATDDPAYSPQLHDVSVGPDHYAVNASQGSCDAPGASSFTCTLGSLAGGGSITIVVPVDLNPSALGVITNTASLTGTWTDGSVLSSTAIATSTVIAQSDLRIVKEDDWYGGTDPVNPGSPMTYTLRVYNAGPSTAWSVMVTDTLPITVSGVITPGGWSCELPRERPHLHRRQPAALQLAKHHRHRQCAHHRRNNHQHGLDHDGDRDLAYR